MKDNTIEQLKKLQKVKLSKEQKADNLNFLLNNIQNSQENVIDRSILSFDDIKFFVSKITAPYAVAVYFLFFILGGWSFFASNNAKPGDVLYFTRIAKENVKLSVITDKKEKSKLSIKFAGNHAKDISNILSNDEIDDEEVDELSKDFSNNIESVKLELDKIKTERGNDVLSEDETEENNNNEKIEDLESKNNGKTVDQKDQSREENTDSSEDFTMANTEDSNDEIKVSVENDSEKLLTLSKNTTTTNANLPTSTDSGIVMIEKNEIINFDKQNYSDELSCLLTEIEDLFKQKQYSLASKKLDYFMEMIDNDEIYVYNNQKVNNEDHKSTSTEDIIISTSTKKIINSTSSEEVISSTSTSLSP